MTRYVLGFLFTRDARLVLMIDKARGPANVVGRLNGIGGKVEPGETPAHAMRREGIEEANADVEWTHYGSMGCANEWRCDLFRATDSGGDLRTMDETEPIGWQRADITAAARVVDNVPLLLAMATVHRASGDPVLCRLDYLPAVPA